jgi:hypothetical protein
MGGREINCSWIECFAGILLIQSSHPHRWHWCSIRKLQKSGEDDVRDEEVLPPSF